VLVDERKKVRTRQVRQRGKASMCYPRDSKKAEKRGGKKDALLAGSQCIVRITEGERSLPSPEVIFWNKG